MSLDNLVYTIKKLPSAKGIGNYASNQAPLLGSPLLKLPLGSVKAGGWIRKQLELMREGLTGRLYEISSFLNGENGWLDGKSWGWEEQPYWLRGFHDLGVLLDDERIKKEAAKWMEAVIASQDRDGYFGPPCNKAVKGANGRTAADLWPHMVMLDALRTYFECSEDIRVITLMQKFFKWCQELDDNSFLPAFDPGFKDWHVEIQSSRAGDMLPHIYWLYNRTGDGWLLDLAKRFKEKMAPPDGRWLDKHVVNFTQRFRVAGNYYIQSKDPGDLAETERWYDMHMSQWGQQPGGIFGADELIREGKTDPRQGCETCAMAEYNKSFYILSEVTGDTVYADRTEDIMFNSYPASHTPDLKALHYLTAGNLPMLDAGTRHDFYNQYRQLDYTPFEIYRCCQHNSAMGWPYYVEHLWMAADGNGLAAWMYGDSEVTALVGGGVKVTIKEKTDYPFDTTIFMTVYPEKAVRFPLYLRIPLWAKECRVKINGRPVAPEGSLDSILAIERRWQANDTIEIDFPAEISLKRWEKSGGSVTVNYGPLSYSLKIEEDWQRYSGSNDWPEWQVFPKSSWNYGLVFDENKPEDNITVKEKREVKGQPWTVENAPIQLSARAKKLPQWKLDSETGTIDVLPASPAESSQPEEDITLIPMGCARLRISCFPAAK